MYSIRSVKTKIIGLSLAAIFITAGVLVSIVMFQRVGLNSDIKEELTKLGQNEMTKIATNVYLMCQAQDEVFQQMLSSNMKLANQYLLEAGGVGFAEEKVKWTGTNQLTKEKVDVELPKMLVGGKWLGQVTDLKTEVPVADKMNTVAESLCSVFQRINPQGDMMRVATNVKTADGQQRALGTVMPALNADGSANPVIQSVLKGQTYFGRTFVVDGWYMAAYDPIKDANNNIIGITAIAVKQKTFDSLKKRIMDIVVGKTGQVSVMGGSGTQRGLYIISPGGKRDGESVIDTKDTNGKFFIQEIINTTTQKSDGNVNISHYPWKKEGQTIPRNKTTASTYFKPWDWVIGAGTFDDDYLDAQARMDNSLNTLVSLTIGGAVILFFLIGAFALRVSLRISSPIQLAAVFSESVSNGDLTQKLTVRENDETGILGNALNEMVKQMAEVVGGIQQSSEQVASSAEELSASSQCLANSATEQAASLEETSASIEELTSSIEQNAMNAVKTEEVTKKAAVEAKEGGNAVTETVQAMKRIAEQISIINDIADQTNLLALNAAIEAARAGEMGKGFAVVAVEVRKLAERSQYAAKEISGLASSSVIRAENAGKLIQNVVPAIQEASQLVQEISAACNEQANGAKQIRQAIFELDKVTQSNSASSEQSASASEELSAQAVMLQEMVSRFKIHDSGISNAYAQAERVLEYKTSSPAKSMKQIDHKSSKSNFAKMVDHDEFKDF